MPWQCFTLWRCFWIGQTVNKRALSQLNTKPSATVSGREKSIQAFKKPKISQLVHEFHHSGMLSNQEYTRNKCLPSHHDHGGWCLGPKAAQLCSFILVEEVAPTQCFLLSYKALSQICEEKWELKPEKPFNSENIQTFWCKLESNHVLMIKYIVHIFCICYTDSTSAQESSLG